MGQSIAAGERFFTRIGLMPSLSLPLSSKAA
jgi:hypothetical protein